MNKPTHIIRYGTNADQRYFGLDFRDGYDIVAVNANMVAFSPNAISTFLGKKTIEKGFFIDPITHAFQHSQTFITSNDGVKIKKSVDNLIKCYGEELKSIVATEQLSEQGGIYLVANRPLVPADVSNNFITSFTKNVIDFQLDVVKKNEKDYEDYVNYAKNNDSHLTDLNIETEPLFLVAPYFFLESNNEWLEKNIKLIEAAKSQIGSSKKLYAQIVLSKKLILKAVKEGYPDSDLSKIIAKYKSLNVEGYLIWIDKYKEHEEIAESLKIYIEMLKDIKSPNKKVYSLYGSYFSVLLGHSKIDLLDGVCHGLEYGESREVVPVGGGLPMPKFYLPVLHQRINYGDMVRIIGYLGIKTKDEFFSKICNCSVCKSLITTNDILQEFSAYGEATPSTFKRGEQLVTMSFATTTTKDLSLRHYLINKEKEYKELNSKSVDEICKEMIVASEQYSPYLNDEKISYLNEWIDALSQFNVDNSSSTP